MKDAMTDHKAEWVLFLRKLSASVREGMNLPDAYSQPVADDYCNDLANEIDAEIDRITAAPAASEGEDGAVAWADPSDLHCLGFEDGHTHPGVTRHRTDKHTMPLYTRPAAQVAATPKHDEGREAWTCECGQRNTSWATECGRCERLPPGDALATQPAARRVTDRQAEVIAFLLGEGPLDGCWYGDRKSFSGDSLWWRKALRESFAQPAEGVG